MSQLPHIPVLLNEVIATITPQDGATYVDATFGAGGYSRALLEAADCKIYAVDRDEKVKIFYHTLACDFPDKTWLTLDKFSELRRILRQLGVDSVDGFVFDVGMSSMQIEDKSRGFSFMHDGPLDMRMGSNSGHINAATFVNALREEEIARVIYLYSGERCSRHIAKAIVNARSKKLIQTTFELANLIRSVVPRGKSKIDPATRTFQSIRIWVNDELKELENGLIAASELLKIGGKIAVVSFHSLEDRIVKVIFNQLCTAQEGSEFELVNKKIITPSNEEIKHNPRARSAKLRGIKRVS